MKVMGLAISVSTQPLVIIQKNFDMVKQMQRASSGVALPKITDGMSMSKSLVDIYA